MCAHQDTLVPAEETAKRRAMAVTKHRRVRMGVVDARKRLTKAMAAAMAAAVDEGLEEAAAAAANP